MGFLQQQSPRRQIAWISIPGCGACEFGPDWKPKLGTAVSAAIRTVSNINGCTLVLRQDRFRPAILLTTLADAACRFRLRPHGVALFQVLRSTHEGARCLGEVIIWPPLIASAASASSDGVPVRCSSLPVRRIVRDVSRVPDRAPPSALPQECDAR